MIYKQEPNGADVLRLKLAEDLIISPQIIKTRHSWKKIVPVTFL